MYAIIGQYKCSFEVEHEHHMLFFLLTSLCVIAQVLSALVIDLFIYFLLKHMYNVVWQMIKGLDFNAGWCQS